MELPVVVEQSGSDQASITVDPKSRLAARIPSLQTSLQPHNPASLTLATLPSLLNSTTLNFISDDPNPFPSGCAQPSSTPLTHHPKRPPHQSATSPDTNPPVGPAFLGSLYTMGDSTCKQMISPGKVHGFPELPPLPGFLAALNDTPVGRVVERGLLWWINRGRERPHFEFFLDRGAAGKRVDSVKEGWLVPPEVSSSTVVECPLKEAWNCAKLDETMFRLVPDKRQVRAAKRIIRRQMGGWAARNFRGTPIFAAHNFNIVMPTENGVQWYTPCFLDKSQLVSALDRSVDLHFDGLIRSRRAQRYNSLDPGGSSGGLGAPPSDADNLEDESSLLDPSDMKDLMEESPAGTSAGMNKMLFHLVGVYIQDTFDEIVLGNKWARRAVGLQPRFTIFADSFEDCAAAAEAAAVAQERFNRELARRSEGLRDSNAGDKRVRQWGPDSFRDSGPPGSTLLGDVVREVHAKRFGAGLVDGTVGSEDLGGPAGAAVDAAAARIPDGRERNSLAEKRGVVSDGGFAHDAESRPPAENESNDVGVRGVFGTGEAKWQDIAEKAGVRGPSDGAGVSGPGVTGSGDPRPSDTAGAGHQRTPEGVADKQWWETVSKHPALQREEASFADRKRKDGVVVNRGPGWEIVRRGPFWNRQYVLEHVAEKPEAGSSEEAAGSQAGFPDGRHGFEEGAKSDGASRAVGGSLRGPVSTDVHRKDGVSVPAAEPDAESSTSEQNPGERPLLKANEESHLSGQPVRKDERPRIPEEGAKAGRATRPQGRSITQQEWDDVKASLKEKLGTSGASGAAARHLKWEALKASVEAKLAVKYNREGHREAKPAGEGADATGERVPGGRNGSVADLKSSPGRDFSTRGVEAGVGTRKARTAKPVAHPTWEEFAEPQAELHPKPEGVLEAAAAHLGLAGVLRDQARMALIAVAAGSPQEKDLQAALDAVTRDIHAKPSAGSETSLMFIANTGGLFAPAGRKPPDKGP